MALGWGWRGGGASTLPASGSLLSLLTFFRVLPTPILATVFHILALDIFLSDQAGLLLMMSL